jgi:hypothetical protein
MIPSCYAIDGEVYATERVARLGCWNGEPSEELDYLY